ncbi:hypothetical protein PFICI_12041 [Pestalotiopsis fici W106-1]|uniref:Uncharacterized protein n=1 Tax=Pestalotiopsis fici (strain W106-1 / CGMCC3.15140) TaxID=1229662 RepID=W3WS55_PESFW|nr:uncharacterized protein PFICI_12041 [Pestalotiopsis fici W106-1]ETS76654.1 hypothetical protein PFICI_12041 [Pestalotiopsis fici W106-1]
MKSDHAHLCLHYDSPATEWSRALPLGNGRLGCMVHGRTTTELVQMNEDSVWYGGPQDRTPASAKHLAKLRQLIRRGKHGQAEELAREEFFSSPASMRHYEPMGSVYLEFGHQEQDVESYKRWLDIATATHSVEYQVHGISIRRDMIASYPDKVLVMRITSSEPIQFQVHLGRRGENEWDTNEFFDRLRVESMAEAASARIVMDATPGGHSSNRLSCVLGVGCDPKLGSVVATKTCIKIKSADCLLVVGAQTTYRCADPEGDASRDVREALGRSWQDLLSRHVADYQGLFQRTSLRLWPDFYHVPTDTRIANRDPRDIGLIALYHNYGKYLLISSSRDGFKALPANLQGIWNPSFSPPWGAKYTININIQMNYWPAATSNLLECAMPLVDLIERMATRGQRTASFMYGCSGWCSHHNTDIWADTDPQDTWMPATLWPLGGLWLCIDVLQMLQYRYDRALHRRLFPILEGCMSFLQDFLIPSADGRYLVTSPSLSPENTYISDSGEPGIFCEGSAMDMTIIKTALELYLWSIKVLELPNASKLKVEEIISRIPPLHINDAGLIQEWGVEDYPEHEPGHRHVSHLFGLYPGHVINPVRSPQLANAARRVLERRAAHGGGHTGWSRAWLLNMHARLWDAEGCGNHMELLLGNSTLPNLFDNHPPFQIDGNFGGCAGIVECIVQSFQALAVGNEGENEVEIRLLPSCPRSWSEGEVSDLCLRDGWSISFEWKRGKIIDPVLVRAKPGDSSRARIIFPNGTALVVEGPGEHRVRSGDDAAA